MRPKDPGEGETMTIKEKKNYLRQYRALRKEELQILYEIRQIKASALPKSAGFSGAGGGSGERDLSDWAAKWDEAERRLAETMAAAAAARIQIEEDLENVKDVRERVLLRGHYIQGKNFAKLGRETGYTERYMWTLHKTALQHFEPKQKECSL